MKLQASFSTVSVTNSSLDSSTRPGEDHVDNRIDPTPPIGTMMMMERSPWREERLNAIAARWKLTDQERERLAELQHRLSDIHHVKNHPEEVVRFVRETHSTKAAERMFRNFIDFRVQQGVDTILRDYTPNPVLVSHYTMTLLDGCDRDGDGIWIERPGVTDCYGLYRRFGATELLRYNLWVRECICHSSWSRTYVAEKKRAPRVTVVIDLQGLNRGHVRPSMLRTFAELVRGVQDYYCGYIKKVIIIREPAIFDLCWSLAKHCFNERMKKMMVFGGSDYVQVLREHIIDDLEAVLPPCLLDGATGTVAEGLPQKLNGGPLPPIQRHALCHDGSERHGVGSTDEEPSPTASTTVSLRSLPGKVDQRNVPSLPQTCSPSTRMPPILLDLKELTDRESMAVRCRLLAKGAF